MYCHEKQRSIAGLLKMCYHLQSTENWWLLKHMKTLTCTEHDVLYSRCGGLHSLLTYRFSSQQRTNFAPSRRQSTQLRML